ncbi:N-chimaerin-like isoform X2 [Anneissia japonica]|uniref:N-chimaerin-like isoform X2 n=1 Tax=Anneissia japonica TaxID=1529436 RepID=UPI00142571B4|nr:N-chimaerin-like isoform X2 [Anneissia japonica]
MANMQAYTSNRNSKEDPEPTMWKSYLYQLQLKAPKPTKVVCRKPCLGKPPHYGKEYHGAVSREVADCLLQEAGEGSYLVRESQRAPGSYTLGLRYGGMTRNYKLFYDGMHYIADKRFNSMNDLVEDGLIHFYMEDKAADYIKDMDAEPIYDKHSKYATVRLPRQRSSEKGQLSHVFDKNGQDGMKPEYNQSVVDGSCISTPDRIIVSIPPEEIVVQYEKAHNFKVHTFGLHWCEYCGNFMWGLIAQGVKCTDCGLSVHKQCCKQIPQDCMPDKRLIKRVYGIDLTTLVKAHNTTRPMVVDMCIKEIEERGLDMEGIYRVPGMLDDVDYIQHSFDNDNENAKIGPHDVPDINALAGALKLFLRQLPIPLIPFELYEKFMNAARITDEHERFDSIYNATKELHSIKLAHYQTLKCVTEHLRRVSHHQEKNKMSVENIAIVFGPTIFRSPDDQSLNNLILLQYQKKVVELFLEDHDKIFDK